MIRVVVIDDSALARKLVTRMLESDPEIEVVGTAMNGVFGLRRIYRDKPDVVTMDFEMPQMDGLETLKAVMERRPTPVVMLSAHTREGAELTMRALEVGAVDFVRKPHGRESAVLTRLREELVRKVKAAARAHVRETCPPEEQRVKPREARPPKRRAGTRRITRAATTKLLSGFPSQRIDLIALGSSTGGVPGIGNILSQLPEDSPPVLCVQHMPVAFTAGFAARLDTISRVSVKEAQGGEVLELGLALIARGDSHLGVRRESGTLVAQVVDGPKVSGHKPSVDFLFWSCTDAVGPRCLGVVLTGMGKDGGDGLLEMRKAGGRTVAESEESCVIYGMPKTAIELGAAEFVLPTESIPSKVLELLSMGGG